MKTAAEKIAALRSALAIAREAILEEFDMGPEYKGNQKMLQIIDEALAATAEEVQPHLCDWWACPKRDNPPKDQHEGKPCDNYNWAAGTESPCTGEKR